MKRAALVLAAAIACSSDDVRAPKPQLACAPEGSPFMQWGFDAAHSGTVCNAGQPLGHVLANVVYDPFTSLIEAEFGGSLLAHYQAPLVSGDEVVMSAKWGAYVSCDPPAAPGHPNCGPNRWDTQTWGVQKHAWIGGELKKTWNFQSDWKPPPNGPALGDWEPVYHAAMSATSVFVPGYAGTVFQLDRATGGIQQRLGLLDVDSYIAGPLTLDKNGNVLVNVIKLDPANPWGNDVAGSWLMRVHPSDGTVELAPYASLVPGAPAGGDLCNGSFATPGRNDPPLPPPDQNGQPTLPAKVRCGSQRPGINAAPAVGPDGTIFTVSRAHIASRYAYVVALNPNLTPKWAASLRDRLQDGCGVSLPADGQRGNCATYARRGIDPFTNEMPAGVVNDSGTSSPVALPDGSVLYGSFARYNGSRGHLMKFGADGNYQGSYDFGWDTTPAWFPHDGTYSIVLKDNEYRTGGPYHLTQLDANLKVEWRFTSTETKSCSRADDGTVSCITDPDNAKGFEWCINAPVVDKDGVVYANSEDGNLYAIGPGGVLKGKIFLKTALGAAYTPLSMDEQGRIYTQNDGHLFVVGK